VGEYLRDKLEAAAAPMRMPAMPKAVRKAAAAG
jgi:hypothetical protein